MKKFICFLTVIFLFFATTATAREIWILHEKTTGYIVGAGRIDREWDSNNRDGSTRSEVIERKLTEGFAVLYLPNQKLPNAKKHKIKNSKIVELTEQDKEAIKAAKPKSKLELLEERIRILEENVQ